MSEADVKLNVSVEAGGMREAIAEQVARFDPSHAQRRFLDRQMTAERKRRRRGSTPADAAALEAAEAKRARRRERNRA